MIASVQSESGYIYIYIILYMYISHTYTYIYIYIKLLLYIYMHIALPPNYLASADFVSQRITLCKLWIENFAGLPKTPV